MLCVILAGQGALFQHHIGVEGDSVLFAVVQDARLLRGAVEQGEVVLDGGDLQPGRAQDLIDPLDLGQVMVGHADGPDLSAFRQGDQIRRPPLHIHGVMDPVHIDYIGV